MRPVRNYTEVGGGNLMEKRSWDLEHAEEAWNEWEIHCLILVSLSLQVFLSLTADLRRHSASRLLSNALWLAYLSADTVAVFVLGHLAVHAQGPKHELLLFWAPFVLVHLGGQDNITAFSKQDNELWTRHLLGLVTQTAVAAYVVSKSSWPDARVRAAMVIMFISGFLKYAGRTFSLFIASPTILKVASTLSLSETLRSLQKAQKDADGSSSDRFWEFVKKGDLSSDDVEERFEVMFHVDRCWEFVKVENFPAMVPDDIMILDSPVDNVMMTMVADKLPDMPKEFKDRTDRCIAYQYVAARLVQSYLLLYTKTTFLIVQLSLIAVTVISHDNLLLQCLTAILVLLTYTLFHFISTTTALVLFAYAQKEGHYSKPDITVSYILLVGAIVLDLLPAFTSILSFARKPFRPGRVDQCLIMSIQGCFYPRGWLTRKQWSEELAQYSMTRRYSTSVEDYHGCMPSIRKWILNSKPIGAWCAEFFDLTHTHVTDDLKLFVLDRLLLLLTRREEWDFASFRGERALGKWMGTERSGYDALHKSLSSRVDFPASVLIWHIATDICYFYHEEGSGPNTEPDDTKKKKMKMSRVLSHYIMYLVFKCDVMLTANSRLVHKKAHEQLTKYIPQVHQDEKETVIMLFEAMKKEEQQQGSTKGVSQDRKSNNEAPGNKDAAATSSGGGTTQELLQRTVEALYSPVLPLARAVAQELIDIDDPAHRWEFISDVWLEMLFFTAPRCGATFHYEHLSTGGEFITHVLFLMRSLGPFMPKPAA